MRRVALHGTPKRLASRPKQREHLENDDRQYTDEERELLVAIDAAKRRLGPFLTWTQILAVFKSLGYTKTAATGPEG